MPIPLRIKICGVTNPDDVRVCADAGADAVGINFHPASPRFVDPRQAQPVLRAVPPLISAVGVFVTPPLRQAEPRRDQHHQDRHDERQQEQEVEDPLAVQ